MTTIPTNSTDATGDVAKQKKDAASAKYEEADKKKQEATEVRAAAAQKRTEATEKRTAADTNKKEAEYQLAKAKNTRDSMLRGMTDVSAKRKAKLLADAAIAGVNITKVKANFVAANTTAACSDAYLKMGLNISTVGACDASDITVSGRRHLLADAEYLMEILLSSAEINQSAIVAALTSLSAAGVTIETTKEDALALLSTIPGIDSAILATFKSDATAAAAAIIIATAAEVAAIATEAAATTLEIEAAVTEKAAVDLAFEATALENEAAIAAKRVPPPLSPSPPPSPPPPAPHPLPPSSQLHLPPPPPFTPPNVAVDADFSESGATCLSTAVFSMVFAFAMALLLVC